MIALAALKEYWDEVAAGLPGVDCAIPLSVEASMADKVRSLPEEASTVLFWLPPSAEDVSRGADATEEENLCVLFLLKRFIPRTESSFEALEATQPAVEALKLRIRRDEAAPCHFIRRLSRSLSTMPETELFSNWAGWSVAFSFV